MGTNVFDKDQWKAVLKARDTISEKVTGEKGGTLDRDPVKMEKQVNKFEKEIEGHGWELQGPDACRLLWELLTDKHKAVLKETHCYKALLGETFKEGGVYVPTSRFSGLATTTLGMDMGPMSWGPPAPWPTSNSR